MQPMKLMSAIAAIGMLTLVANAQSFLTNGLVAYYPFNGNANDASGHGNNGTIYGGVALTSDRFGIANSAYTFNGVDGYIDVGNPVGNSPAYLTETAWLKLISRENTASPGFNPVDVIITKRNTAEIGSGWPTLAIEATGQNTGAGEFMVDDDGYQTSATGTSKPSTNVWFFICGVKSNNTYQIYINGILEKTLIDSHPLSSAENMFLMHDGAWGTYCNGVLDDVRIYNRALSSNEVAMLYLVTPGPCTPHAAEATAQIVNGFVVGSTITDPGCGYTNAPLVLIQGGGGSNATATATMNNGFITSINIINPGAGYTNAPDILIASPPFVPTLSINVSRVNVTQHVVLGLKYVLESSFDMITWTPTDPSFTAQSEIINTEFVVSQTGQFFRIRQVP